MSEPEKGDHFYVVGPDNVNKTVRRDISIAASVTLGMIGLSAFLAFLPWYYAIPAIIVLLFLLWFVVPKLIYKKYSNSIKRAVHKYKDAHTRFDKVPLEDMSLTDKWYHEGALLLWSSKDKAFDLFYNWLRDTGITSKERVTVYEVTQKQMFEKYPFMDHHRWSPFPNTIYVLPLSDTDMPGEKEKVWYMATRSHNYVRFISWFAYLVNGTRNEKDYGFIHEYKDFIENFEEL